MLISSMTSTGREVRGQGDSASPYRQGKSPATLGFFFTVDGLMALDIISYNSFSLLAFLFQVILLGNSDQILMHAKGTVSKPAKCTDSQVCFEESTKLMVTCLKFSGYSIWLNSISRSWVVLCPGSPKRGCLWPHGAPSLAGRTNLNREPQVWWGLGSAL